MRNIIAATLLLTSAHANGAILFAGGEDVDLRLVGAYASWNTNPAFHDAIRSRVAASADSAAAAVDPPANYISTGTFSPSSDFWTHFVYYLFSGGNNPNAPAFVARSSDGLGRLLLLAGPSTMGLLSVWKSDTARNFTKLADCALQIPLGQLATIDVHINYSVAGGLQLYANGVLACAYSGDVTTNSVSTLNEIYFAAPLFYGTAFVSEVIVSTTDTRGMVLQTLAPVADGASVQWGAGLVANVNPIQANDAVNIYTTNNNYSQGYTIPSLVAGSWNIVAVKQTARVQKSASGPQNFSFYNRTNGSNATQCSTAPTSAFVNYSCYSVVNPQTSLPWVSADFAGANFGLMSLP